MRIVNELKQLIQLNKFSDAELQVVNYILEHPEKMADLSSRKLAQLTFTSPATVIRVCQKTGASGYSQFRLKYLQEVSQNPNIEEIKKENPITRGESFGSIINKMAALEKDAIEETKKAIDYNQIARVGAIFNKSIHIDFYAFDDNLYIAKKACSHFLNVGMPSSVHDGSNAQYMQAHTAPPNHSAIILSRTGENRNLVEIAGLLKERKIPCIVLTESRHSTLASLSTEHLYIYNVHKFTDMGTALFQISAQYVLDVFFALLFSQNYDSTLTRNNDYYRKNHNGLLENWKNREP